MRCNNHQSHGPSRPGGEIGNTGNAALMCSHTERERQDGGYNTQKIGNKGNSFQLDDSYAELSPPVSGVDQSGGSGGGEPVTYVHLNPPPHPIL